MTEGALAAAASVASPVTWRAPDPAGRAPGTGTVMLNHLARIIFDSISDGVFTVDEHFIITSFNKAAERITGFRAAEAIGKHCFEIFRTEICHKRCALRDTLSSDEPGGQRAGDDHHPGRARGADQRQHRRCCGTSRARSSGWWSSSATCPRSSTFASRSSRSGCWRRSSAPAR